MTTRIIQRFGTQFKFHIVVISKIGLLRRQKKSFDLITIVSRVHTQDDPEKSTKFENVTNVTGESARGQRKLFNSFIIR